MHLNEIFSYIIALLFIINYMITFLFVNRNSIFMWSKEKLVKLFLDDQIWSLAL